MFENLSFDSSLQDESGLESMVDGTFMENSSHDLTYDGRNYTYITGLLLAGQESGVSPYHLASRILQEQGNSGYGSSISGIQSGYRGYYNYYNIGAYASGGLTAVQNGLKFASRTDDLFQSYQTFHNKEYSDLCLYNFFQDILLQEVNQLRVHRDIATVIRTI